MRFSLYFKIVTSFATEQYENLNCFECLCANEMWPCSINGQNLDDGMDIIANGGIFGDRGGGACKLWHFCVSITETKKDSLSVPKNWDKIHEWAGCYQLRWGRKGGACCKIAFICWEMGGFTNNCCRQLSKGRKTRVQWKRSDVLIQAQKLIANVPTREHDFLRNMPGLWVLHDSRSRHMYSFSFWPTAM